MLFQAEELIKKEMMKMLHHDAVYNPTLAQQGLVSTKKGVKPSQKASVTKATHLAYLEQHPLQPVDPELIEKVCKRLFVNATMMECTYRNDCMYPDTVFLVSLQQYKNNFKFS